MPTSKSNTPSNGEKVATLIRIWKAAVVSNDAPLRSAAEIELSSYGIAPADLQIPTAPVGQTSKLDRTGVSE